MRRQLIADVNDEIRALGERLDRYGQSDWPFRCECGSEGCSTSVLLSIVLFDELKQTREPLLAPGHPVAQARSARAQSESLRDAAVALRAQARHQLARARRLRGGPGSS